MIRLVDLLSYDFVLRCGVRPVIVIFELVEEDLAYTIIKKLREINEDFRKREKYWNCGVMSFLACRLMSEEFLTM